MDNSNYTYEDIDPKEAKKAIAELADSLYSAELRILRDSNGKVLNTARNYRNIIYRYTDLTFGKIRFNELTMSPERTIDSQTKIWSDADDSALRTFIEYEFGIYSKQKFDDGFKAYLLENSYHPLRDMITGLQWDGESRIHSFLIKWLRAEDTPYTREVSRLIFAGGIHRLFNPGCKFDDMVVLMGTKQGEGKSTVVRWLALEDQYFTEVTEFEGQKGIEALTGAWICEVSELLALTKTKEQEAVKSYLSRLNDRYRAPFDKRVSDNPRQCIFIGTTNKEQFLTDKTGNRRFYPVKVNQRGYELFDKQQEVKEYIRQCWAEAYDLYKKGKLPPYADRSLYEVIRKKQADAVEDDYRIGMIKDYLEDRTEVCILQLWQEALRMPAHTKPEKKDSNELALIMQSLYEEWEKQPKTKRIKHYGVQKWWKRIGEIVETFDENDLNM